MSHTEFTKTYCDFCNTFSCMNESGEIWKCAEKCKRYQEYIDKKETNYGT